MIFRFFVLFFISLSLSANVDSKIKNTNTKLKNFSKSYSSINKKMARNAKAILKQKKQIHLQQKHLQKLALELSEKESSHKENIVELVKLKEKGKGLKKTQEKLEEELVFTIAKSVSLSVILEEKETVAQESLIEYEVLEAMLKDTRKKAKELNKLFYDNSKIISRVNIHVESLKKSIKSIDAKRKNLLEIQKKNKKDLKNLEVAKSTYKKELKKILLKQDSLKKTLAKLNLIKIDEIRKAKEAQERKKAFDSKAILDTKLPKVKKYSSSYQAVKTKRYRGRKTIAPLDSYTITKKYGTYTDPIYGIKVFNESISLKPKKKKAKVKTVFNGKVIYADKVPVLDNIVIVEHKNGLHTIYANLSQIAPKISKGRKIKKGFTIGRVDDELIFEVTQKSYHINPARLFR